MTTDLITRLNQTLADIDAGGVSPRIIRRDLTDALTALRTSYRDGWLGAAEWLKNDANRRYNEAGDNWLAPTNIKTWEDGAKLMELALSANHRKSAAQDLRRNAPQEATDES